MNLEELLFAMISLYHNKPTKEGIKILLFDLNKYPEKQIIKALYRCRLELKYFPSLNEIMNRMDNSHPGENEAWAICPKNENDSVYWTNEIKKSYFKAISLIDDLVAARMTFIELYRKEISLSRLNNSLPEWHFSWGYDKTGREKIILEVMTKGLISQNESKLLLEKYCQNLSNNEILKIISPKIKMIG